MARPKKENNDKVVRLSVSIKATTMVILDEFIETKCMVKSKLVDKIIREYIEAHVNDNK